MRSPLRRRVHMLARGDGSEFTGCTLTDAAVG